MRNWSFFKSLLSLAVGVGILGISGSDVRTGAPGQFYRGLAGTNSPEAGPAPRNAVKYRECIVEFIRSGADPFVKAVAKTVTYPWRAGSQFVSEVKSDGAIRLLLKTDSDSPRVLYDVLIQTKNQQALLHGKPQPGLIAKTLMAPTRMLVESKGKGPLVNPINWISRPVTKKFFNKAYDLRPVVGLGRTVLPTGKTLSFPAKTVLLSAAGYVFLDDLMEAGTQLMEKAVGSVSYQAHKDEIWEAISSNDWYEEIRFDWEQSDKGEAAEDLTVDRYQKLNRAMDLFNQLTRKRKEARAQSQEFLSEEDWIQMLAHDPLLAPLFESVHEVLHRDYKKENPEMFKLKADAPRPEIVLKDMIQTVEVSIVLRSAVELGIDEAIQSLEDPDHREALVNMKKSRHFLELEAMRKKGVLTEKQFKNYLIRDIREQTKLILLDLRGYEVKGSMGDLRLAVMREIHEKAKKK